MMGSRHMPLPPLYWGRERTDRQQRYEPLPDRYGRPSDFYVGFEDLNLDGRGRTIVDVRTIDPRYIDTPASSPGRAYQSHLESNFPRSGHRDRDREPRFRSAMPGGKSSVSFGRGMKKLEKVLQKSEDFFQQFIQDFDNDMTSTAGYATLKIQEELWRLKVAGKKDKRTIREDQNQHHRGGDEEEEGEKPKKKFEERKRELVHALQVAMNAQFEDKTDPPTSRSKAQKESAKRLQEKICGANGQLVGLLEEATQDRDQCDALLNEIQLLKALLDTQSEKNKELFKDDDDGSSDAGEEGRGSYGWDNN